MQRLVSIHTMDPRGTKVGGIETHVRQLLRRHPADMRMLAIGIDEFGDLELGRMHTITVAGREIDFVPLLHVPPEGQAGAARSIGSSLTFRFAKVMAMHLPRLRRMIRGEAASAEVERFEFAPLARAMGCPLVVLVHTGGDPRVDKMDSILSRHWWINDTAEWLAFRLARRIFCVTPQLKERLAQRYPAQAAKAEVLTVSVDTQLFKASPFDTADGVLRVVYAGRLDDFKDPPLMFRVAKRLHEALGGAFEFHYCGASDPHRFAEFAGVEPFTVRHGALGPEGVAAVMSKVHIGMLTSLTEGMPCFLLELLASGRPFGGVRLPQFDQVVRNGINGRMVDRSGTIDDTATLTADAVLALWDDIRNGRIDPVSVHQSVVPWSVDVQMGRLFSALRDIARPGDTPAPALVATR